jgi:hypothetical protein
MHPGREHRAEKSEDILDATIPIIFQGNPSRAILCEYRLYWSVHESSPRIWTI